MVFQLKINKQKFQSPNLTQIHSTLRNINITSSTLRKQAQSPASTMTPIKNFDSKFVTLFKAKDKIK